MTEIEKKALALVNEVAQERGYKYKSVFLDRAFAENEALCRAIEQHEAFKREVSDTVEAVLSTFDRLVLDGRGEAAMRGIRLVTARFILPKPVDPLVEALKQLNMSYVDAEGFRAALAARGLEIREIEQ